ncbi:ATRX.2 family protein [Megaselia abdita]
MSSKKLWRKKSMDLFKADSSSSSESDKDFPKLPLKTKRKRKTLSLKPKKQTNLENKENFPVNNRTSLNPPLRVTDENNKKPACLSLILYKQVNTQRFVDEILQKNNNKVVEIEETNTSVKMTSQKERGIHGKSKSRGPDIRDVFQDLSKEVAYCVTSMGKVLCFFEDFFGENSGNLEQNQDFCLESKLKLSVLEQENEDFDLAFEPMLDVLDFFKDYLNLNEQEGFAPDNKPKLKLPSKLEVEKNDYNKAVAPMAEVINFFQEYFSKTAETEQSETENQSFCEFQIKSLEIKTKSTDKFYQKSKFFDKYQNNVHNKPLNSLLSEHLRDCENAESSIVELLNFFNDFFKDTEKEVSFIDNPDQESVNIDNEENVSRRTNNILEENTKDYEKTVDPIIKVLSFFDNYLETKTELNNSEIRHQRKLFEEDEEDYGENVQQMNQTFLNIQTNSKCMNILEQNIEEYKNVANPVFKMLSFFENCLEREQDKNVKQNKLLPFQNLQKEDEEDYGESFKNVTKQPKEVYGIRKIHEMEALNYKKAVLPILDVLSFFENKSKNGFDYVKIVDDFEEDCLANYPILRFDDHRKAIAPLTCLLNFMESVNSKDRNLDVTFQCLESELDNTKYQSFNMSDSFYSINNQSDMIHSIASPIEDPVKNQHENSEDEFGMNTSDLSEDFELSLGKEDSNWIIIDELEDSDDEGRFVSDLSSSKDSMDQSDVSTSEEIDSGNFEVNEKTQEENTSIETISKPVSTIEEVEVPLPVKIEDDKISNGTHFNSSEILEDESKSEEKAESMITDYNIEENLSVPLKISEIPDQAEQSEISIEPPKLDEQSKHSEENSRATIISWPSKIEEHQEDSEAIVDKAISPPKLMDTDKNVSSEEETRVSITEEKSINSNDPKRSTSDEHSRASVIERIPLDSISKNDETRMEMTEKNPINSEEHSEISTTNQFQIVEDPEEKSPQKFEDHPENEISSSNENEVSSSTNSFSELETCQSNAMNLIISSTSDFKDFQTQNVHSLENPEFLETSESNVENESTETLLEDIDLFFDENPMDLSKKKLSESQTNLVDFLSQIDDILDSNSSEPHVPEFPIDLSNHAFSSEEQSIKSYNDKYEFSRNERPLILSVEELDSERNEGSPVSLESVEIPENFQQCNLELTKSLENLITKMNIQGPLEITTNDISKQISENPKETFIELIPKKTDCEILNVQEIFLEEAHQKKITPPRDIERDINSRSSTVSRENGEGSPEVRSKTKKPETSESELEGFQSPNASSAGSSPPGKILRVLRSRIVLSTAEENEGSEYSYKSDDLETKNQEAFSDSEESEDEDVESEIPKEIKRTDTQNTEVREEPGDRITRLDRQSSIDPEAYEIEEISNFTETDIETSSPICAENQQSDLEQNAGDECLMENEIPFIKEEIDIDDYVYFTDEELEETILNNLGNDDSLITKEILLDDESTIETSRNIYNSNEVTAEEEVQLPFNESSAENSTDSILQEILSNPSSPNEAMSFAENLLAIARILHEQCLNLQNDQVGGKMIEVREYLQRLTQSITPPKEIKNTQTAPVRQSSKEIQTDDLEQVQKTSTNTQTERFRGKNASTQYKVMAASKKTQTKKEYHVRKLTKDTQTGKECLVKQYTVDTQTDSLVPEAPTPAPEIFIKAEPVETIQQKTTEVINLVDYSDSEGSETLSTIYEEVHRALNSEEIQVTPDILIKEEPPSDDCPAENYFEKSRKTKLVLGDPATLNKAEDDLGKDKISEKSDEEASDSDALSDEDENVVRGLMQNKTLQELEESAFEKDTESDYGDISSEDEERSPSESSNNSPIQKHFPSSDDASRKSSQIRPFIVSGKRRRIESESPGSDESPSSSNSNISRAKSKKKRKDSSEISSEDEVVLSTKAGIKDFILSDLSSDGIESSPRMNKKRKRISNEESSSNSENENKQNGSHFDSGRFSNHNDSSALSEDDLDIDAIEDREFRRLINLKTLDSIRLTRCSENVLNRFRRKHKKKSVRNESDSEYSDTSYKDTSYKDEVDFEDIYLENPQNPQNFDEISFLKQLNESDKIELLRTSSDEGDEEDESDCLKIKLANRQRLKDLCSSSDSESTASTIELSPKPKSDEPMEDNIISLLTTDDESTNVLSSTPIFTAPKIKIERRNYDSDSTEDGKEIDQNSPIFSQHVRAFREHFRTKEQIDHAKRNMKTLDQMIVEYDSGKYKFRNTSESQNDTLDLSSKQYGIVRAQLSRSESEVEVSHEDNEKQHQRTKIKEHLNEIRAANRMPASRTKFHNREEHKRVTRLSANQSRLQKVINKVMIKDKTFEPEKELILDFDNKEKIFIKVDRRLVDVLKNHQKDGIKFMYDCCYGTVNQMHKFSGSGCILAHCMGLGKTLQLIALINTLISYPNLKTKKILVLCPKSTVLNWTDEIANWLGPQSALKVFIVGENSKILDKLKVLDSWGKAAEKKAGILILGYEAFRHIAFYSKYKRKDPQCSESAILDIQKRIDAHLKIPGPDLVICDEGHIIKNRTSAVWAAVSTISTLRRIVLTGTPMQNNLNEYYAMVDFIKPGLLGTERQFGIHFSGPIRNGQHADSSREDIKLMKKKSFILHKKVQQFIQRKEVSILKTFLPTKFEYVLFIPLTDLQDKLYEECLTIEISEKNILYAYNNLRKIWTHPKVLEKASQNSKYYLKKRKRLKTEDKKTTVEWWTDKITDTELNSVFSSNKIMILFEILRMCNETGDKCLIFSSFVAVLNMVEDFMYKIHCKDPTMERFVSQKKNIYNSWENGKDYYRIDGSTPKTVRQALITNFNDRSNKRARVFLISGKAGGQGINLFGANRVIILDTSWNPSQDQQNIFRVFRLGQDKNCYVYRLLSMGTMEEKVYSRSVTKQAMSFRVCDEQNIDRHYTMTELSELYAFTKPNYAEQPTHTLPQDLLLKELLSANPKKIFKYHEHDSLLENKVEEELTEEERLEAWAEFRREQSKLTKEAEDEENPKEAGNENEPGNPLPMDSIEELENLRALDSSISEPLDLSPKAGSTEAEPTASTSNFFFKRKATDLLEAIIKKAKE